MPGGARKKKSQQSGSSKQKKGPRHTKEYEEAVAKAKLAAEDIEVKRWSSRTLWAWDAATDACSLCRNDIHNFCIECQARQIKVQNDQCAVVYGTCLHQFHYHCIKKWLNTRDICPLDNRKWEYMRRGG